jgi:hypothetical protein
MASITGLAGAAGLGALVLNRNMKARCDGDGDENVGATPLRLRRVPDFNMREVW